MAIFRSGIDLLATIIIPACLLGYWNFYTQTIIKRRAKILLINEKMKQTRSERQKLKHTDSFTLTFQTIDQIVSGMYYRGSSRYAHFGTKENSHKWKIA